MDSLLGQRSAQEHEATTAIKTEFMQLWEGFETGSRCSSILVLGATNQKDRLDDAVLRRFSLQYEVRERGGSGQYSSGAGSAGTFTLCTCLCPQPAPSLNAPLLPPSPLSTPLPPCARLQVKLPCAKQREAILRLTLARHVREMGIEYVDSELLPTGSSSSSGSGGDGSSGGSPSGAASGGGSSPTLRWLAERTEGFSGSDLVQLCSQAAAVPIQAMIE